MVGIGSTWVKGTSHIRGRPWGNKNHTHASFTKILANCISEESLINAVYDKNKIEASFLLRKCREPVRREKRPKVLLLKLSGAAARAKWLHSLIHKASINKICQAFAIFWLAVQVSAFKVGAAKSMRLVLRKWTPRVKYFKYQNFPTDFRLSLFLICFGQIWRKSVKSIYPINLLKVVVFLPILNARF